MLSGYYGFGNAGDEALLAGLLAGIHRVAPHVVPVVLSGNPELTRQLHGVECTDRSNPVAVWRALGSAQGLISGGGSLLQDVTSRRSVFYYLGVMAMAGLRDLPYCVYGQGIGPLTSRSGRAFTRWILQRSRGIWVRDPESKRQVLDMGVRVSSNACCQRDPVLQLVGDPAFLLPAVNVRLARERLRVLTGAGTAGVWVVALRPWGESGQWWPHLADALARAAGRCSAVLAFLPMHPGVDDAVAVCVAARARNQNVPCVVLEARSFRQVQEHLAGADMVIAMRLHALILAVSSAVASVAISYDPKVMALAKDLPLPWISTAQLMDGGSTKQLAEVAIQTWSERQERSAQLRTQANLRRETALSGMRSALVALGFLGEQ